MINTFWFNTRQLNEWRMSMSVIIDLFDQALQVRWDEDMIHYMSEWKDLCEINKSEWAVDDVYNQVE
jgi:hypothetical protein